MSWDLHMSSFLTTTQPYTRDKDQECMGKLRSVWCPPRWVPMQRQTTQNTQINAHTKQRIDRTNDVWSPSLCQQKDIVNLDFFIHTLPTCEIRDVQICCSIRNCYSEENILSRPSLISYTLYFLFCFNNIASPFRDGKAKENSYKCLASYSVPNARRFALCCHLLV